MANIAEVIAWKFNNQEGMRCEDDNSGLPVIVEFPGGIPSQAQQDAWTAEYDTWLLANPPQDSITADDLFNTLVSKGLLASADRPTKP